MYHRPIGCSESDYSSCLQLIREDDITCAQSSMVKVAIDNNDIDDNENVNGDYDGIAIMPKCPDKGGPPLLRQRGRLWSTTTRSGGGQGGCRPKRGAP